MCIIPTYVDVLRGPKWEKQAVPCKKCWRCRKSRVDDYVGRCLAEAATSQRVCVITLTYAPRDDLADKVLHPRHFQMFMKQLRNSGHKVRYLVAGEYGTLTGRAHFHAILFFSELVPRVWTDPDTGEVLDRGPVPTYNPDHLLDPSASGPFSDEIAQMRMSHIREWPHGHVKVDWSSDEKSIRYVCKYLLADDKNNAWFSLSKKPALGAAWFALKAEEAKRLGVLPSSFQYAPPGGSGNRRYTLTGASRRDYLNAITTNPADKPRMSEWTLKTFEKHERARLLDELSSLPPDVQVEAFIDRRSREEQQKTLMRFSQSLREAGELDDLMQGSEQGSLRWSQGQWTPNTERKTHE